MFGAGRNEGYERAIKLFDQGMLEEAVGCFQQVLAAANNDPVAKKLARFYMAEAYVSLGNSAEKRGAWERAGHYFESAIDIHPNYPDLHFNLSRVYRQKGDFEAALASLERALEINPKYAKAHFHKGLVLYSAKRTMEAFKSIERALELEPGFATETYYA